MQVTRGPCGALDCSIPSVFVGVNRLKATYDPTRSQQLASVTYMVRVFTPFPTDEPVARLRSIQVATL